MSLYTLHQIHFARCPSPALVASSQAQAYQARRTSPPQPVYSLRCRGDLLLVVFFWLPILSLVAWLPASFAPVPHVSMRRVQSWSVYQDVRLPAPCALLPTPFCSVQLPLP